MQLSTVSALFRPPADEWMRAVLPHPVVAHLAALHEYHRGHAPLVEQLWTVWFHQHFAHSTRMAQLEEALEIVNAKVRAGQALLGEAMMQDLQRRVNREVVDAFKAWAGAVGPEVRGFLEQELGELSAQRSSHQAAMFRVLLKQGPEAWQRLQQTRGAQRVRGRHLAPAAEAHWRDVADAIKHIVRHAQDDDAGPLLECLYPQERDFLRDYPDMPGTAVAAYLTWERAGRFGAFRPFAAAIGVRVRRRDLSSEFRLQVRRPLLDRYRAPRLEYYDDGSVVGGGKRRSDRQPSPPTRHEPFLRRWRRKLTRR